MSSWSSRRKAMYFWSVVLILSTFSFGIFWQFWYKVPTCSDGLHNGDETGIDCGGSCALVCPLQALAPVIRSDPRIFKIMDNLYSVLTFVENHNVLFEAPYVPYKFKIYDNQNEIVYEREGVTKFDKNRTISIFEGNMLIPRGVPKRAEIELPANIAWVKNAENDPKIEIVNSPLLRQDSLPRIEATVSNKSIEGLKNIELVAIVYDGHDNAIAGSRTFINNLVKNSSADIFFTWPKPFDLGEVACSKFSDVVVALDRSGSMASISKSPPEPLTSVKNAASYFVSELKEGDSVGFVSFGTTASVERNLTGDFKQIMSSINTLNISGDGIQYTNIADALSKSSEILLEKENDSTDPQSIIVILTDGVATRPTDPKARSESEEITFAEAVALEAANIAKQNGVVIYTIGLGNEIHRDFLREIAGEPENFFEAPAASTLKSVYKKISSSVCKELPSRIEITYKILNYDF